jgi:hypothetical protein
MAGTFPVKISGDQPRDLTPRRGPLIRNFLHHSHFAIFKLRRAA